MTQIRDRDPIQRAEHVSALTRTKTIILTLSSRISRDNTSLLAAAIAFYAFTAVPSALTAVVSLYGLAFNPHDIETHVTAMQGLLPGDVIDLVSSFLQFLTAKPPRQLSLGLFVGFALALWSVQSATGAMITALNLVNDCPRRRSFIRYELIALGTGLGVIGFTLISFMLIGAVPTVLDALLLPDPLRNLIPVLRWPLLIAITALAIAGIYRFAPERWPGYQRSIWGILLGTAACFLSSFLFATYVNLWAIYTKAYGSLAGVLVFLAWLYLTSFSILLGAEFNATLNDLKQ
jgi:membrane protein